MTSDDTRTDAGPRALDYLRWTAALVIVAASAALVAASHYLGVLEVCETKTTSSGEERTCGPFPVIGIVPLLALAAALLWKDLSEVELFGLGRVVRRLDEGQRRLHESQDRIERQLQLQWQRQDQMQNQSQQLFLGMDAGRAAGITIGRHPELAAMEAAEEEPARVRFEGVWEQLRPWSVLASRLHDPKFRETLRGAKPDEEWHELEGLVPADQKLLRHLDLPEGTSLAKLESWARDARPRLEVVRRVRAAGPDIPEQQVDDATVVARGLLTELAEAGLRQRFAS